LNKPNTMDQKFRISMLQVFVPLLLFIVGCTPAPTRDVPPASAEETAVLLEYLEGPGGNLINSGDLPSLLTPEDVLEGLTASNQLIIDLRTDSLFAAGHIEHAVNLRPDEVLHYFEQVIEPNSFERIVMVCSNAMLSAYVNGILRHLGYTNVFTLRNGLSAWNSEIAADYWLPAMSAHLEGKLETAAHPKNPPGPLPAMATGRTSGYEILRARAAYLLAERAGRMEVTAGELIINVSDYYIVNYWPKNLYDEGHIEGSVQYSPRASLHSGADLFTLPAERPIVIWCYTGHTSAYVVAFLNLLGYEAYNQIYGANAFIHETMRAFGIPTRTFDESTPRDYPLVRSGETGTTPSAPEIRTETRAVEGGC
jgi:rhodanese-related sulfurtransferase